MDLPQAVGTAAELATLKFGVLRLDATNTGAGQLRASQVCQALITATMGKTKIFT